MGGIGIYSEEAELLTWLFLPRGIRRGVGDLGTQGSHGALGLATRVGEDYRALYALGFCKGGIYDSALATTSNIG